MRNPRPTSLDDQPISVRAKLAAAWTSLLLLYAYVDIIAFFRPGVVENILDGTLGEFDLTQPLLTIFLVLMAVPISMIVLSTTLPARTNRALNLVVAAVQIPYASFNALGEAWTYFYGLGVALEVTVLLLVLRWAWTWPLDRSSRCSDTAVDLGAA